MLRATVHKDDETISLQLEGRLAGPAVFEAERCWQAIFADHQDRPKQIDLRGVSYMDREGISFLKQVFQQGASFLSSGCLTRAYVEEITDSGKERAEERHAERSAR